MKYSIFMYGYDFVQENLSFLNMEKSSMLSEYVPINYACRAGSGDIFHQMSW